MLLSKVLSFFYPQKQLICSTYPMIKNALKYTFHEQKSESLFLQEDLEKHFFSLRTSNNDVNSHKKKSFLLCFWEQNVLYIRLRMIYKQTPLVKTLRIQKGIKLKGTVGVNVTKV